MAKCRVCTEKETIGSRTECEDCWPFYKRAYKKFREDRDIKIKDFNNEIALAYYLRGLYRENKYCAYTGLEMMVADRRKINLHKELQAKEKQEGLEESEKRELEELEEYKRTLAVLGFSIDRKISKFGDEKGPYSKKNIVLCIRAINTMKGEFKPAEFIQACYQVLAFQVENQTIFADQVISMFRNFNVQHRDKSVVPLADKILQEEEVYKDFDSYREDYKKQINAKHNRRK
ncbi:hypothetical protein ACQJ18_25960 [Priestia megaterium]|uniref:hypothetical protein n=1 Tax=Priestia megaterium TaxID=1404 RepID=UPI003D067C54